MPKFWLGEPATAFGLGWREALDGLFEIFAGGGFVAGAEGFGLIDVRAIEEALEDFGAFGVEDGIGDVGVFLADGGFVFLEALFALAEDGEVDVAEESGVWR